MKLLLLTFQVIVSLLISGRLAFLLTPNLFIDKEIFTSLLNTAYFWLIWLGLFPVVLRVIDFGFYGYGYIVEKRYSSKSLGSAKEIKHN